MKKVLVTIILIGVFLPVFNLLFADEHWVISNIKGYTAYAPNYKYIKDASAVKEFVVVFTEKGGSVSNSDLEFIKLNDSTLVGIGRGTRPDTRGYSVVNVYQINRKTNKLHYIESRIGTHTLTLDFVLHDKCGSMVGDAKRMGYLPN
ncbi:MAG: hypothetical protein VW378_07445 [bacterium]